MATERLFDDDDWPDSEPTNQEELDDYIHSRGDIDKCMNCGKYMYGDELDKFQVCKTPCRNPNEY